MVLDPNYPHLTRATLVVPYTTHKPPLDLTSLLGFKELADAFLVEAHAMNQMLNQAGNAGTMERFAVYAHARDALAQVESVLKLKTEALQVLREVFSSRMEGVATDAGSDCRTATGEKRVNSEARMAFREAFVGPPRPGAEERAEQLRAYKAKIRREADAKRRAENLPKGPIIPPVPAGTKVTARFIGNDSRRDFVIRKRKEDKILIHEKEVPSAPLPSKLLGLFAAERSRVILSRPRILEEDDVL